MTSLLQRRSVRVVFAVVALLGALLVTTAPVGADTTPSTTTTATPEGSPAVTYTAPGTALSVTDGQSVAVHVARTGSANVFGIQARICKGGATINNLIEFSPGQTGLCAPGPLDPGTDNAVPTSGLQPAGDAPANTFADVSFVIGAGTTDFASFGLGFSDFTCGPGNPCELVLRQSTSDTTGDNYIHFNLNYAAAPTAPGATGTPTATAGNTTADVSWTAPSDDGGSPITGYVVTPFIGATAQTPIPTGSTATTFHVTGLANFTAYTFQVHAVNVIGPGPDSSKSNAVTPLPVAPSGVTGAPGDSQVTVSWTAANPAPTNYTVNGTPSGTCTTATTSCVVTGLTNGTPYTFKVTANYPAGTAVSSSSSPVTPNGPTKPGAPTAVTASPGNQQASLTWTAPTNTGNSTITSYTATSSPGGLTCTTATTGCTVAGLTNFTAYTFTVTATNAGSLTSDPSVPSNSVTPLPTRPVISNLTAAPGQVTVTWSASSPAPTNYTVTSSPGGLTCTTATTSCAVTGLTNGTSYTFTVTANYGAGTVVSTPSSSITPAGPPGAPTAASATAGNGQATVSWTAPADDGGAPITGYTVTSSPGSSTCTSATTSCTVTGLTNFTPYSFTVTATNAGHLTGDPSSPSNTVTPLPSKPVISTVTPGNAQVTVSWSASSPAPTNYTVTSSPDGKTCTTATTSCTVTGLTNGTGYTFTVTANYGAGTVSSLPSASVTPEAPTPPGSPTGVSATPGSGQAVVHWTAPGDPGTQSLEHTAAAATITSYTVTASPGGATCTTATTSCTVTGLTNFTPYTFSVTATNSAGLTSDASASSPQATPVPTKPVITKETPGDGQVVLVWSASDPAPNGYTVTGSPGGTCTTTQTTCTITGLTNGTPYTFTVTATFDAGTVVSVASAAVTPAVPATTTTTAPTSTTEPTTGTSAATGATSTTGTLPRTGSNDGFLLELAALSLLCGGALVMVSRRRQRTSTTG